MTSACTWSSTPTDRLAEIPVRWVWVGAHIHRPLGQASHARAQRRLSGHHEQPHGAHGGHRRPRGAHRPCDVEVHSDSQYVVNAFNQHWVEGWQRRGWKTAAKQPVKNPDLWRRLLSAMGPHDVTWVWVKGHAGHELNERCDELATTAAEGRTSGGLRVQQVVPGRLCAAHVRLSDHDVQDLHVGGCMPTRPTYPMERMVSSASAPTRPSPARNEPSERAMSQPRMAASTAAEIFAAQLGLAPSQTMPPTLAMVLTMVASYWASEPPRR